MAEQGGSPEGGQEPHRSTSPEGSEHAQARDQGQEHASGGEQKAQQGSDKNESSQGERQEKQGKGGKNGQGQQKEKPSRAEWVVGTLCSVVVLAAVAYLFYQALSGPSLPPMVTVQVERVVPMRSGGYLVEIRAVNEGSSTTSNLMLEGALMQDTTAVEKSTATLDFVPAGTARDGGLFFTRDPRQYRLVVRPTGYDRP